MRLVLGYILGWVVRLWARTWRVSVQVDPGLDLQTKRPLVFVFWHGTQMSLTAVSRRRPTCVLVSCSQDGCLQNGVMRALGMRVVRGSSSRQGASGLLSVIRGLRSGQDAAFAVDGPRGPRGSVKPGAELAARLGNGLCVPLGCAVRRKLTVRASWDRFAVPLPFTRVLICMGAPLACDHVEQPTRLAHAINAVNVRARAACRLPA
jgi:lysophospholipid acyltransferase (LPLAT)-like uncharacterized protein